MRPEPTSALRFDGRETEAGAVAVEAEGLGRSERSAKEGPGVGGGTDDDEEAGGEEVCAQEGGGCG